MPRISIPLIILLLASLAGCTEDEVQPLASEVLIDDAGTMMELVEIPLRWQGEMAPGVVFCSTTVLSICIFGNIMGSDGYEFNIEGEGQGLSVEMTWDATHPANQELGLGLYGKDGDWWEWIDGSSGTSPLSFETNYLGRNATYKLMAYKAIENPVGHMEASTPQHVAIEGIATTLQPVTPENGTA